MHIHPTVKQAVRIVCITLAVGLTGLSQATDHSATGYDFTYVPKGDRTLWPTQVFDNGNETFFQFPQDRTVPAIFALDTCGSRVLLTPQQRGPYLVVEGVNRNYVLQLGQRSSSVDYNGMRAMSQEYRNDPACAKPVVATRYGAIPAQSQYGVAKPIFGDVTAKPLTTSSMPKAQPAGPANIEAAKELVAKAKNEQALKQTSIANVTQEVPSIATPVQSMKQTVEAVPAGEPAAMKMKWEVKATDMRLATTLERWAEKAGHKLQWDAERHFLIEASTTYTGSFEEALIQALNTPGIRYSAYPLEACIYENEPPLVRITRQGVQAKECAAQ